MRLDLRPEYADAAAGEVADLFCAVVDHLIMHLRPGTVGVELLAALDAAFARRAHMHLRHGHLFEPELHCSHCGCSGGEHERRDDGVLDGDGADDERVEDLVVSEHGRERVGAATRIDEPAERVADTTGKDEQRGE